MAETRYILKILSGLHAGAEFYLPPGVTRLGKSPDCDLVLHDQGLDDEHFIFRCAAQEARVECPTRASAALLDGMESLQENGAYTIRACGLVSSAGLYLALGAEGADWDIPTPAQLFAQFSAAGQPAQADPGESGGAGGERGGNANAAVDEGELPPADGDAGAAHDAVAGSGEDAGAAGDKTAAAAAGDAADTGAPGADAAGAARESSRRQRRIPPRARFAGAGALAVALLGAGLYYWHGHAQQAAATRDGPALTLSEVETIAARFNIDASFEFVGDNLLHARGHALNNEEKQAFIRALYARGVIVRPRLIITEDFKNNILNILEQLLHPARHESLSVTVKADDIKTLVLQGYVQDAEQWRAALAETMEQVDMIAYEDEVTHWDDGYQGLQALLERHGLAGALRLEQDRQNDRLILFARDNDIAEAALAALAQDYYAAYARPGLRLPGADGEGDAPLPAFTANKVLGASFNVLNYLLLDDGQRYFVGSLTPAGYRIDEINEAFAILSLDATDYVYYFDEPDASP